MQDDLLASATQDIEKASKAFPPVPLNELAIGKTLLAIAQELRALTAAVNRIGSNLECLRLDGLPN